MCPERQQYQRHWIVPLRYCRLRHSRTHPQEPRRLPQVKGLRSVVRWRKPDSESRPPASFRPAIHPIVDGFVPELRVLGLEHPVAFVRKVEHFRRHPQHLQRAEKLQALADIETVVALAVD